MSSTTSPAHPSREIEYLSAPAAVSMADRWFEISSLDHFWVRRRFEVLQSLAGGLISPDKDMAEVGCGHGLLQRQIEDACDSKVTGFDLNEFALKHNLSRRSRVCSYNIFQRERSLQGRFDVIFLFDVLEHIAEEDPFLEAVLFHLKPEGKLLINVPAGQWAFSAYDTAAGHVRRYSIKIMQGTAKRNRLALSSWSYWGLPLLPSLMLRKVWLLGKQNQNEIISSGFDTRSVLINESMGVLSHLEWLPQKLLGTSLMAILHRIENRGPR